MLNLHPEEIKTSSDSERLSAVIQNLTEYEFGTAPPLQQRETELVRMQTLASLEIARQVARLTEALAAKGT